MHAQSDDVTNAGKFRSRMIACFSVALVAAGGGAVVGHGHLLSDRRNTLVYA